MTGILILAMGILWLQSARTAILRDKVARRQLDAARLDELRTENGRLRARVAQPLLLDKGENEAVRKRIAALKQQLAPGSNPENAQPPAPPPAPTRLLEGAVIPAGEWKHAGRGSPESALETALWAALGGDVDAFAGGLTFVGNRTRAAAQALLQSLPPDARTRYQTPERLVAALTIPEVPTGAVEVQRWHPGSGGLVSVEAKFSGQDGDAKVALLIMKPEPDGWKLMVGDSVVAKYAAQLKGPPSAAASAP